MVAEVWNRRLYRNCRSCSETTSDLSNGATPPMGNGAAIPKLVKALAIAPVTLTAENDNADS